MAVGAVLSIVSLTVIRPSFVQDYTRLKVVANQWAYIKLEGITYYFEYQAGNIIQNDGQQQVGSFAAELGNNLFRGIELTVSEVHADYVISLARALSNHYDVHASLHMPFRMKQCHSK